VGTIRCFEPQVVANHLLRLENSKLRVDMGLRLHRLEQTTSLSKQPTRYPAYPCYRYRAVMWPASCLVPSIGIDFSLQFRLIVVSESSVFYCA